MQERAESAQLASTVLSEYSSSRYFKKIIKENDLLKKGTRIKPKIGLVPVLDDYSREKLKDSVLSEENREK